MNKNLAQEKKYKKIITVLSIIIPLAVAALFGVNLQKLGFDVEPLRFLPPIYASVNGLTAIVLIAAVIAIKKGNRKLHERLNTFAIFCSLLFLVMYVAYHMTSDSTKFGDLNFDGITSDLEAAKLGMVLYLYRFILVTHIVLSIVVIPFVLTTYMRAKLTDFPAHKKIAKITFPLWLYVAVTGVIVYVMISPYYVQ
jgi:putative membrane protein|tara:strand:- start:1406 stop:1993 length:588 start_codon:yes stop_codon:yes gene_type:complete